MRWSLFALVVALLVASVAACGSDDESTPVVASSAPSELPSGAVIEVVFDGAECARDGPATIPAGQHSFLLRDTSDRPRTEMWVSSLADGHSHDELLALQDEAGGQGSDLSRPAWVMSTPMVAPASSPADGQTLYSHSLEPGPHTFVVGGSDAQWVCGPFDVVEE